MINKPLKLNLQLFAEKQEDQNTDTDVTKDIETLTLTPEELAKKIESEADRKLNSALKKKQDEFDAKLQEAIEKAKEEGKTYAQMTEEQRENAEFERKRKEFEEQRAQFERERLNLDIQADLQKREMPLEFADALVLLNDKEAITTTVAKLEEKWNQAINQKVKEALVQETPLAGTQARVAKVNEFAQRKNEARKEKVDTPNPWA